jgi:transglutaminase-like putative cysteine protease
MPPHAPNAEGPDEATLCSIGLGTMGPLSAFTNHTFYGGLCENSGRLRHCFSMSLRSSNVAYAHHPPLSRWDILSEQSMLFSPGVDARDFFDPYGNICTRLVAPSGLLEVRSEFVVDDSGLPDEVCPAAQQWDVGSLPGEVLPFLLASRYCDTEKLSNLAWSLFGSIQGGWQRAQAICDYTHDRIEFGYHHARGDRTASEGHEERRGVCRDFAHLAVTLSRCMNIPARYCTGYLGDIGVPIDPAPMDFSARYEVFLDGRWFTLDARHNHPRIGRIVIAKGRDAADVAISTAFGPAQLARFNVITEEFKQGDQDTRLMEAA